MPTVGEFNDINRLLDYVLGHAGDGKAVPTSDQAMEAAARLAERCHTQHYAGLSGADVRRLWAERRPRPVRRRAVVTVELPADSETGDGGPADRERGKHAIGEDG